MSSFKKVFPEGPIFLAVIHTVSGPQAVRNAKIAEGEGAHGVFLINHSPDEKQSLSYLSLIECYHAVREKCPNLWVGLNCLDIGRAAVNYIPKFTAGLWVDDAGITENPYIPTEHARRFTTDRRSARWQGLYFGGVAFKGQKKVDNPAKVAAYAVPLVDVITTSGPATGQPPEIAKIRAMREAISDHPLAIASGITPENVGEYIPYANCFLVATGISESSTELNPARVRAMAKALG